MGILHKESWGQLVCPTKFELCEVIRLTNNSEFRSSAYMYPPSSEKSATSALPGKSQPETAT